jgi:hypothetical protein
VGYSLADGRYVDDQGKTWKNYNDAAAASATRKARSETEFELGRQQQYRLNATNKLQQGQLSKQFFGWVPGLGAAIDRGMEADARAKAEAEDAMRALTGQVRIYKARMGEGSMPPTRDLSNGNEEPGGTEPPKLPSVLSDDADARASEARRMLQQATPYWEREENQGIRTAAAVGGGPRAGEAGYAQRADIQAWMEANKNAPKGADGKNIVDRFLEQQQKRGLLDAPSQGGPGFGGERIAMPVDSESAVQAGIRGLVGSGTSSTLELAQADVSERQSRARAAYTHQIFQAAAEGRLPEIGQKLQVPENIDIAFQRPTGLPGAAEAFTGLEVGQPFTNPEMNRQLAALGQPAAVQAVATGTGSGINLQPSSAAASEAGVEPAQPDAPGNKPNPADDLARRYIDTLRTTRAARLGA